ncbi:MAG TPA: chromate transporter [Clostridia bacterium]|nr:chromate transporter [Clostridia bacterium]
MNVPEKNYQLFFKLFLYTFYLSAFTFGGGYVIVPLMRKKFVEQLQWIEEDEMLNLISIAQSAPGAMAVNTSILVGYHLAGFLGAFVTILGTILPPLITLSLIALIYTAFKESRVVNAVLKGMSAGVAAVVLDAVIKMGKRIWQEKKIFMQLLMAGAFIAIFFFEVDVKVIILASGILGLGFTFYQRIDKRTEVN